MRVGSLFSGIGGLDLGFEQAGFTLAWQCEADPFCRAVLQRHWPDVPVYDDVRAVGRVPRREVPAPVDVLIGGFPCQDVSLAGKQEGLRGARSGLWFEFERLIGELRPRYVVVENVPGLLVRGIDEVLGGLAARGYDAEWAVIRASDVGAPHQRARVFIVAHAARGGLGVLGGAAVAGHGGHADGGDTAALADADGGRCGKRGATHDGDGRHASRHDTDGCGARDAAGVAQPLVPGLEGPERAIVAHPGDRRPDADAARPTRGDGWPGWPGRPGEPQHAWEPPRCLPSGAQPPVGGHPDGVPPDVAGRDHPAWRRPALQALGNAVVPAVAYVVACRVRELAGVNQSAGPVNRATRVVPSRDAGPQAPPRRKDRADQPRRLAPPARGGVPSRAQHRPGGRTPGRQPDPAAPPAADPTP